jgi:hypothetical protein
MTSESLQFDRVEQIARKLWEQESGRSTFLCIPWAELSEDERDDLRNQVYSVLCITENRETPTPAGMLGLPPPLASTRVAAPPESNSSDTLGLGQTWPKPVNL